MSDSEVDPVVSTLQVEEERQRAQAERIGALLSDLPEPRPPRRRSFFLPVILFAVTAFFGVLLAEYNHVGSRQPPAHSRLQGCRR
ncbi:MAG: hypothetical protein HY791_01520 [Deltaproteobacteria bacterium]|nr:hypothetical protein [Deltaproteobacteria bacterium]